MKKRKVETAVNRQLEDTQIESFKNDVTASTFSPAQENHPRKQRRKFSFIAIHLGAGDHSSKRADDYQKLCDQACSQGLKVLRNGATAGQAVVEVTKILEDSGILNAGLGSNLTIDKTVECDAGFMDGDGYFGGVGAVPGVPNPILVAKSIADTHKDQKLFSCGRVPPNFLVGQAAKSWAETKKIPICDDKNMISKKAEKTYGKYMNQLRSAESGVNDTVGAIALDNYGHVASAVSSGGHWLKFPGRIGHSPLFGCGCWSSNSSITSDNAIAVSTSGSGEILSRIRLPQECACVADSDSSTGLVGCINSCIRKHLLDNASLNIHHEPRYLGMIALLWDGNRGEFAFGHTTNDFVVAYSSSKMRSVKMNFSNLGAGLTAGQSVKIESVCF